ncbi:hypothetical protein DFH06DRAFT_1155792 [Mycena polygramma]|nr:hypothetical protein DFH06DRAFT_1155792 [Mycena polygramma]
MAHLPPTLCTQGVDSKTFKAPDMSLTVSEMCDWHYKHSKMHPLYVFVDAATDEVFNLTWGTAVEGIYRISHSVIQHVKALKTSKTRPMIGLCSTSDSFTYLLSMLGIIRAGYPVFLMSPFAPPAVLRHLISISGVSLILTNPDDPELYSKLSAAATEVGGNNPNGQTVIASQLTWSQIFSGEGSPDNAPDVNDCDLESASVVLHSSGSTTLPRLNVFTHKMVTTAMWQPWYGEHDICGEIMSAASVPLGGAAGTMFALFPATSGLIISGLKPQSPAAQKTPMSIWKAIVATKSTYAFLLHPFIYMFSADPQKREILARLKGLCYSGGPLRKAAGDQLALEGANVLPFFGSSEAGLMNKVLTDNRGEDWEYFSFYSLVNPAFVPQEDSDLMELIIKAGPFHRTTQTNTVFEDAPAFVTKDLLQPHPTKPGFWKYVCRVDDQETLIMGMRINAVAFEKVLSLDPLIRGAVIFSRGSTFGVVIDPVPEYAAKSDLSIPAEADKLKTLIWPTVERFNELVPEHGKLKKDIVLFTSPDKPFVYGEKGLPRRKEAIRAYVPEIEASVGSWPVV